MLLTHEQMRDLNLKEQPHYALLRLHHKGGFFDISGRQLQVGDTVYMTDGLMPGVIDDSGTIPAYVPGYGKITNLDHVNTLVFAILENEGSKVEIKVPPQYLKKVSF